MPKRIQRQRTKGWQMPQGAVYVGRPSRWGNPCSVERYGREKAVLFYREIVSGSWTPSIAKELSDVEYTQLYREREAFLERFRRWNTTPRVEMFYDLRGYDLACWCPLEDKKGNHVPCHADVLLEIANA